MQGRGLRTGDDHHEYPGGRSRRQIHDLPDASYQPAFHQRPVRSQGPYQLFHRHHFVRQLSGQRTDRYPERESPVSRPSERNGPGREDSGHERTGSVCGDLFAAPFARTAYRYGALRESYPCFRASPENGNRIRRNKPLKTNNMPNAIPCPCCRNPIYFDLALLLKGEAFECSQCHSRISLTPQSRPIVAEASARLEELKQKASRQLDEKPEKQ